jgi:hypothetical protein
MGKFNRTQADNIVHDFIKNHIAVSGNIVYEPTGCLPYVNGQRVNGDNDYPTLKGKLYSLLGKSFSPTKSFSTYINVYINKAIRAAGLVIDICHFDINGKPTYSTAKPSSITIEVVRDEDSMSVEEADKFNTFINSI